MARSNLRDETVAFLDMNGKTAADVVWVGSRNGKLAVSWDDFARMSDVQYDAGFGAQEVANDLVVVGRDWWLERWEYDGSEGWSFKTAPTLSVNPQSFSRVIHPERGDASLRQVHLDGDAPDWYAGEDDE